MFLPCSVFAHAPLDTNQVAKSSAEWADSMQSLAEFSTVEDFWKVYNNVPKPSQVRSPVGLGPRLSSSGMSCTPPVYSCSVMIRC